MADFINRAFVKSDSKQFREFQYSLGAVSLKFSLRVDHKRDLRSFKSLLEAALNDVTEEMAKK